MMGQTEARRKAKELTQTTGRIYVAVPVPLGSWGGQEKGWDVIPAPPMAEIVKADILGSSDD
jgi:hypothetical protein